MAHARLTISGLFAGYPSRPVIEGLDLGPLRAGEVTALVGPNAAGKSTLLLALAGLVKARGSIRLGTDDLLAMSAADRAARVAFMPQSLPQGVALTVLESVIAALRASPGADFVAGSGAVDRRAVDALARLGIADLASEALDRLSGGQRQLVSLAQAAAREPSVLLLDEPTSALDLRHQVSVMRLVRELAGEGRVVVVVMHDLNLAARWADQIAILHRGALRAHGTPAAALTREVLADVYGVAARVARSDLGHVQVSVDDVLPG